MLAAIDQFTKEATSIMHEVALLYVEVILLHTANKAISKRRRVKRTRVQLGGSLSIQDAQDLLDQKNLDQQIKMEERPNCSQLLGQVGYSSPGATRDSRLRYYGPACVYKAGEGAGEVVGRLQLAILAVDT